ncbi:MAG: 3-oxoacyl-[acyl-carrier-protein] reductase [Bacteriovoracaceae bacterium]|nr:3-oxoacyl-[acyl-carrier-protein] reductase [Bacteriovoracaceae bacterium]
MSVIYPDLKSKIILITGATRGIGRAIALSLGKQGAHVVFNYRKDPQIAKQLESEIQTLGGKATSLQFDLNQFEQVKTQLDLFTKEHGVITGLINNAGISKDQLLLRIKEADIDEILNTNLKASMLLTSHLSRSFLKAEHVSIVNMSSVVGMMGNVGQATYAASKAGLIGFTKSVAKELASRNIRCNAVCPGFISTEMTQDLPEKTQQEYLSHIPLNRFGTVDNVADLICFLMSQSSSYITGSVIKIDGGLYI